MKHYSDFSTSFCAFDWQDILEDFTTLVNDKTFDKLPYSDWKYLWRIAKNLGLVETEVSWAHSDDRLVEMEMIFRFKDGTTEKYICANCDNSFGDFLYENYLYGVELDTMHEDKNEYLSYDGSTYVAHDWNCAKITGINSELSSPIAAKLSINSELDSPIVDAWDTVATKADTHTVSSLQDTVDKLITTIEATMPMNDKINTTITNKNEENNIMKFNFDFGPVNPSTVRMSMYGMAVKNKAGTWVSYDTASGNIVDVDVFNFDGAKFLYKMPVAIKDIAAGDIVIHNSAPMFVLGVPVGGKTLTVVDVISGERKDIMLATSPFGFNFATKVVNFLGNVMNSAATAENPFGNMWMLMAMSGDNKDMKDMLPLMMMANGGMDMSNPMLMMALMGDNKIDPMMLMAMSGAFNAPKHECKCGGHCGETHAQA